MEPDTQTKRYYYLDNLKIFLTVLVIVHHVGQAYGPTGGFWQYQSSLKESVAWLGPFFGVNAGFFMGMFFLISGYFVPGSYDRKGGSSFLKDKLLRFGPPLVLALFIMVPLEMYFYYSFYSGNMPLNFFQYYKIIYFGLEGRPDWFKSTIGWPEFNLGHLWFVEHLLLYSFLYWLGRNLFSSTSRKMLFSFQFRLIILQAFVIASITAIVREWYPIDKWIGILGFIQTEVAHLPQYVLLFITGILSYRLNWFMGISKKTGYLSLVLGLLMAIGIYTSRIMPAIRTLVYSEYHLYESFMAVFLCWGLIVLFRENLNGPSSFTRLLAENSYAAYIFHYPIVLALQFILDEIVIFGAWGKFITVSFLAVLLTYTFSFWFRKLPYVKRVI